MKHIQSFEGFLNESTGGHEYQVQHKVGDEIVLPVVGPCQVKEVGIKPKKTYTNPWVSASKDFTTFEQIPAYLKVTHSPASVGTNAIRLETMDSFRDSILMYQYKANNGKVYTNYAYI